MRKKLGLLILIISYMFLLGSCDGESVVFDTIEAPLNTYEQFSESDSGQQQLQQIMVHVCGAVHSPGVISLPEDSRVIDAINLAGGMTTEADGAYLNLAAYVCDGEKVYVPTVEEVFLWAIQQGQAVRVNINLADEERLCTLPGIGESKARDIIAYREEYGEFQDIEDIMKVPGIKESSFLRIKDLIAVK